MKLQFGFSNLCGTVYKQGNLLFHPDGNSVISPVGNRITVFDLVGNKSTTLPFQNRKNIKRIALSPNGTLLLSVDEDGRGLLCNFERRLVLHHQNFKADINDIAFSPDGKFIAVTHGKLIELWKTHGLAVQFMPFELHRRLAGHYDDVLSIKWSADSLFFLATSKDMTVRVFSRDPVDGFQPSTLTGHRDAVVAAWFSKDNRSIYSVSRDGSLFIWNAIDISYKDEEGGGSDGDGEGVGTVGNHSTSRSLSAALRKRQKMESRGVKVYDVPTTKWSVLSKHYFNESNAKLVSVDFNVANGILVAGFSTGVFGIWELPDFTNIHMLSASQKKIDAVTISPSAEWLAIGCSRLGQLVVWEWKSESYILKQQGHQHEMNCLSYSQDGQYIVTGGDDGKVKLWNTQTGFCFVTFADHSASVQAVEFTKKGQVVFSASLDGTVRAFDMVRYRNFRTFTSPSPVQFGCLAVDPSGELVTAGSVDTFEIYVWSVQTGKLLEILSGHEGPVSCLSFSPTEGRLISGSWDHQIKTWDIFERSQNIETLGHGTEVLAVVFRPDGRQVSVATLDGQITIWDIEMGRQVGSIDGRYDIVGGRKSTDKVTAKKSSTGKYFTSLCYTGDGEYIIAGGNSRFVCIYHVSTALLVKRFQISHNLSLDGMHEKLDSRNMTEAGPADLIDDTGDLSDLEDRIDKTLPGAKKGDLSLRANSKQEIRTKGVRFSPNGRTWAAASTEGLLIYTLDDTILFDPFDLEIDITPEAIEEAVTDLKEFLRALVMAFRLGQSTYIEMVYLATPHNEIALVVRNLPHKYLDRMIKTIVDLLEKNGRLQFHLLWTQAVVKSHGQYLKERYQEYAPALRALFKFISNSHSFLSKITNENLNTLKFIAGQMEQSREDAWGANEALLALM